MAAPYYGLEFAIEDALVTVIEANVTTAQLDSAPVLAYCSSADLTTGTRIICQCVDCRQHPEMVGNWHATVEVEIRTHLSPSDTRTADMLQHKSTVAYVRDILMRDDLDDLLQAAATNLSIQAVQKEGVMLQTDFEDDFIFSTWRAVLLAAPNE